MFMFWYYFLQYCSVLCLQIFRKKNMMFDNLIFKENGKFYINLNNSNLEVVLYKGDNIKFSNGLLFKNIF